MRRRSALLALLLACLALGLAIWALKRGPRALTPEPGSVFAGATPFASSSATSLPSVGGPASKPSLAALSPRAVAQLGVLNQILASRNDNDPRMDSDLRELDESAKAALRSQYGSLAPEKRNERGTIVFLLGRNLTTSADFAFFKDVLSEAPCLSPLDCSKSMADAGEAEHQGNSIAILLAYPQLTALKALEHSLSPGSELSAEARASAVAALNAARASRAALVVQAAERVRVEGGR